MHQCGITLIKLAGKYMTRLVCISSWNNTNKNLITLGLLGLYGTELSWQIELLLNNSMYWIEWSRTRWRATLGEKEVELVTFWWWNYNQWKQSHLQDGNKHISSSFTCFWWRKTGRGRQAVQDGDAGMLHPSSQKYVNNSPPSLLVMRRGSHEMHRWSWPFYTTLVTSILYSLTTWLDFCSRTQLDRQTALHAIHHINLKVCC